MKVVSVNIQPVPHRASRDRGVEIPERVPVSGRIMARLTGLDGDGEAPEGEWAGLHRAIYAYPAEHYAWWAERTRQQRSFGQLGEHLTVAAMSEQDVGIGDCFRVGGALLQVTQPGEMDRPLLETATATGVLGELLQHARVGFFLKVVEDGEVAPGAPIRLVGVETERMPVAEIFRLRYVRLDDLDGAHRALRQRVLPLGWHRVFEERLTGRRRAGASPSPRASQS